MWVECMYAGECVSLCVYMCSCMHVYRLKCSLTKKYQWKSEEEEEELGQESTSYYYLNKTKINKMNRMIKRNIKWRKPKQSKWKTRKYLELSGGEGVNVLSLIILPDLWWRWRKDKQKENIGVREAKKKRKRE